MKIAFIAADTLPIPSTKGGATETLVTHLVEQNSKRGDHTFIIYSYWENNAEIESSEINNSEFRFYKPSIFRRFIDYLVFQFSRCIRIITGGKTIIKYGFIRFVCKDLKDSKPDIVVFEGNTMQVRQAYEKIRIPFVLHLHSDILNEDIPIDKNEIIKCVKNYIAVSEFAKDRISAVTKQPERIFVLKNVIDKENFDSQRFTESEKKALKGLLGIEESDFVIIYCGRVVEKKGILDLVKAMKKIPEYVKLIIVGSSWFGENKKTPFIETLEQESKELGSRIIFTGYIKQTILPRYYSISNLAIFPSRYNETAGLVVLEALSCGVPVVVPNFAGMYEFAPKESSYSVETRKNCTENLINIINSVLNDKKEYEQKKNKARNSIKNYDLDDYYYNFCSIIKEVVKK